jgi:hypothetical protein
MSIPTPCRSTCNHSTHTILVRYVHILYSVQSLHTHIYHPLLVNSLTLLVTSLNPFLNLARHLSLFSLFLFSPFRSWYFCLCISCRTIFLATKLPNIPIPLTKSLPFVVSSSTVRPYVGFKRGYMANVSFCCTSRFAASLGLLDLFGSNMSVGSDMASKFSLGARSPPRRKGEAEGLLKSAPKTWLDRAARTSSLDVDCPRGANDVGGPRCLGMPEKRESMACEALVLGRLGATRRTVNGSACVGFCEGVSFSSSCRCGCAAGWLGVLDMHRWAVHDGEIRLIWESGVRVRAEGRSSSSPSDRELMAVYV